MPTSCVNTKLSNSVEAKKTSINIGELPKDAQVTTNDTGWNEKEKERMRQSGYDGVDIVRAWYS